MPPIRVLVVDDSVVIRKVLCNALAVDSDIEIAGTAGNGRIALSKIPRLNPDIITLDVEMPEMNGIETLVEIRKSFPKIPVIMFSTLTERGASITFDALALGASDYATKPSNAGSLDTTAAQIRADLIPKIKSLCTLRSPTHPPAPGIMRHVPASTETKTRIDVLAIGTSTGGPNALAKLLSEIPHDFPVPIVLVQHMPPLFTRLLAERLNGHCQIAVREAEDGVVAEPGTAWIAPGDHHIVLKRVGANVRVGINQGMPENSCRPAVDPLFRSVAAVYGPATLAVVLTGMGSDGVQGARFIREAGGRVIVQDEASSVVWGMPGHVAAAGLANNVYPLDSMAQQIIRLVMQRRSVPVPDALLVGDFEPHR